MFYCSADNIVVWCALSGCLNSMGDLSRPCRAQKYFELNYIGETLLKISTLLQLCQVPLTLNSDPECDYVCQLLLLTSSQLTFNILEPILNRCIFGRSADLLVKPQKIVTFNPDVVLTSALILLPVRSPSGDWLHVSLPEVRLLRTIIRQS